MPSVTVETPAAKAMRLLSAKRIAHACDLTTNAVWKWESVGGGRIPSRHMPAVLGLARELDVELTADELIGMKDAA